MLDFGGYKRLGGKNGLFASRNTTYFVTLIVLVIVGFLFYLYNNVSNDAANLRRESNAQSEHIAKLKNEILEGNVDLEKARSGESACQNAKSIAEKKSNNDVSELNKLKAKVSDLEASVSEKEESIKSLKQELNEKSNKLEKDAVKKSAMEQYGTSQEAIIIKLNETIELMKKDLALKDDVIHGLKQKLGSNLNEVGQKDNQTKVSSTKTPEKTENVISQPKDAEKPQRPDEPEHLSAVKKLDKKGAEEPKQQKDDANNDAKLEEDKGDAEANEDGVVKDAEDDAKIEAENDETGKKDKPKGEAEAEAAKEDNVDGEAEAEAAKEGNADGEAEAEKNDKPEAEAAKEDNADGEAEAEAAKEDNVDGEAEAKKNDKPEAEAVKKDNADDKPEAEAAKEDKADGEAEAEAEQDDTAKNANGDGNVIRNPEARIKMEQAQQEDEKENEDKEKGPLVDAAENEKN